MRITILFGGTNKERLVSVASAQALHSALPDADLWFWDADDSVHQVQPQALLAHSRPFEDPFKPGTSSVGRIAQALDKARAEDRLLVLGLHGGTAENGELQAMCEMRGIPFTGSGSASSHLAFDKIAAKRFAEIAGELVRLNVDVIVTSGKPLRQELPDGAQFWSKPWVPLDMIREAEKMSFAWSVTGKP